MPDFADYQTQLVGYLTSGSSAAVVPDAAGSTLPMLIQWIDNLPYFGQPEFEQAFRGAFSNILQVYLANELIEPEPSDNSNSIITTYTYSGSYTGYQNAFYGEPTLSSAADALGQAVAKVNGWLDGKFWSGFAVVVLTDAIETETHGSVDTTKLSASLTDCNSSIVPVLSAGFASILQNGYATTAGCYSALSTAGDLPLACSQLSALISSQEFIANINESLASGGDAAGASTWFLYSLWVTLQALGDTNVDSSIQSFISAGLNVPEEIGPAAWWTCADYTIWFSPLSGADVAAAAGATIRAGMPEIMSMTSTSPHGQTSNTPVNEPLGYSASLCYWGKLNWFKPKKSSCFGAATRVLMADGTSSRIDAIRVGDLVHSCSGSRRVLLVESPRRGGRPLWQVNNLEAWATEAHPFRSGDSSGPARRAVDPWALMNAVPSTMTAGVGTLQAGVSLAGLKDRIATSVLVDQLKSDEQGIPNEKVYDLILERVGRQYSCYFVGGPDVFLAVDSEAPDPFFDPVATLGVLAAFAKAAQVAEVPGADPWTRIDAASRRVPLHQVAQMTLPDGESGDPSRPVFQPMDFFNPGGIWNEHRSALEAVIVSRLSRFLRRESALGWRSPSATGGEPRTLKLVIHSVELGGDESIERDAPMSIVGDLQCGATMVPFQCHVPVQSPSQTRWYILVDHVFDLGCSGSEVGVWTLRAKVMIGTSLSGYVRAVFPGNAQGASTVQGRLFGADGRVFGRIELGLRAQSCPLLATALDGAERWSQADRENRSIQIGTAFGNALAVSLKDRVRSS